MTELTFVGGAETVTGSNFLLDLGDRRLLIDCGIEEREDISDRRNFNPFSYKTDSIDDLFVTHAHADHIGRIPRLVREGFRGPIHSTEATKELAAIMFEDSIGIMKGEHDLLYTNADVEEALALWRTHEYHEEIVIGSSKAQLLDAGHILGSSMIRIERGGRSIVFTGDLGNANEPLLKSAEKPTGAHYLVMESVYGDRVHESADERRANLVDAIETVRDERGTLLIPSFSLERTQVLLSELKGLMQERRIEKIPVYLDAPLAIRITDVYRRYTKNFNSLIQKEIEEGNDPFSFDGLTITKTTEESRGIHKESNPKIIIAGAGMSGGGRIRAHEMHYLPDPHAVLLFIGYQAPGTLGRRILDGERKIVIDYEHVKVRAQIRAVSGYSGHMDRDQLLNFVEGAGESVSKVFVTMGELRSSLFFAQRVHDFLGIEAIVPEPGARFNLEI